MAAPVAEDLAAEVSAAAPVAEDLAVEVSAAAPVAGDSAVEVSAVASVAGGSVVEVPAVASAAEDSAAELSVVGSVAETLTAFMVASLVGISGTNSHMGLGSASDRGLTGLDRTMAMTVGMYTHIIHPIRPAGAIRTVRTHVIRTYTVPVPMIPTLRNAEKGWPRILSGAIRRQRAALTWRMASGTTSTNNPVLLYARARKGQFFILRWAICRQRAALTWRTASGTTSANNPVLSCEQVRRGFFLQR
jgi:hypothetical protein